MTNAEPTIAELRQVSEQNRAALANSVHALRNKIWETTAEVKTLVSPAHLKDEVKSYVRHTGSNLVDTITARAKENPLQALAAGAAVAVPLFKLFRAVPLPLVLIGAGYWLSGTSGRAALNAAGEKLGETFEAAGNQASDMMASAAQTVADVKDSAMTRIGEAASSVAGSIEPVMENSAATFHDLRDSATGLVRDAKTQMSSAVDAVAGASKDMRSQARSVSADGSRIAQKGVEAATWSQQSIADLAQKNPLMTAAIGIAAGALLASAFPVTAPERKVFGDGNARLKRAGRDAMSRGVDSAKAAADEVVDAVVSAAGREGITREGVRNTMRDVSERAKTVADKVVQGAYGVPTEAKGETR